MNNVMYGGPVMFFIGQGKGLGRGAYVIKCHGISRRSVERVIQP